MTVTAKRSIIHVGGSPGSGKSRLARSVTEGLRNDYDINAEYISLGDRLRQIGRRAVWSTYQTEISNHLNDPADAQLPFATEIVERVVSDALSQLDEVGTDVVLLDGFPRYVDQVDNFAYVAMLSHYALPGSLHTTIDDETALVRMLKRGQKHSDRHLSVEEAARKLAHHHETYPLTLHQLSAMPGGFQIHDIDTSGPRDETTRRGIAAALQLIDGQLKEAG